MDDRDGTTSAEPAISSSQMLNAHYIYLHLAQKPTQM